GGDPINRADPFGLNHTIDIQTFECLSCINAAIFRGQDLDRACSGTCSSGGSGGGARRAFPDPDMAFVRDVKKDLKETAWDERLQDAWKNAQLEAGRKISTNGCLANLFDINVARTDLERYAAAGNMTGERLASLLDRNRQFLSPQVAGIAMVGS